MYIDEEKKEEGKSFNEENNSQSNISEKKSFSSTQPELLAVAIIVDDAINIFCVLSIFTFVCISINVLFYTLNMNSYRRCISKIQYTNYL